MASTFAPASADLRREHARMQPPRAAPRAIAAWLLCCCALVFVMVVVGGVTRLTHSGLSITEWQPIVGTVPPLTEADWSAAFARYQQTPEFRQVNHAMTVAEFKGIFWWEYAHRLLGRVIGVAFLVPFAWFALRRRIPGGYTLPLAGLFMLGGLQGVVGWYMVKSGLVDDPRVSPLRLALHLLLAFLIFGAMLWTALSLLVRHGGVSPRERLRMGKADARPHGARAVLPIAIEPAANARVRGLARHALAFAVLVLVMVVSGALVAGIRAGFAYNTFPLMNGQLVPPEILMLEPAWRNVVWNMATVQFDHRVIALVLVLTAAWLWVRIRATPGVPAHARNAAHAVVAMLALQVSLGIATLLHVVPLPLAALHQAGAVVLFGLALVLAHALRARTAIALTTPNGDQGRSPLVQPESDHGRDPRT